MERWLPVPGYEGLYDVSDQGRVRRYTKTRVKPKKPHIGSTGYVMISLWKNNHQKLCTVHGLVAAAFLGPRPDGLQVRHLDGDYANPHLSNLTYGTPSQNALDQRGHGTNFNANKTHCPQDHPYDKANTGIWISPEGWINRYCRTCAREKERRKRNRRLKEAQV